MLSKFTLRDSEIGLLTGTEDFSAIQIVLNMILN